MSLIYIFKHNTGEMTKVGKTTISAELRLKKYIEDHSLEGFSISKQYTVDPSLLNKIESRAHKLLVDRGKRFQTTSGARELFLCGVEEAINAVEQAIKDTNKLDKPFCPKSPIEVIVFGVTYKAKTLSDLARQANVSPSNFRYHNITKGHEIAKALSLSLEGKKEEKERIEKRKLTAFRMDFESVSALAKSDLNKLKIDKKTLQKRIYKLGMTPELALKTVIKPRKNKQKLTLPDGKTMTFDSIKEGYNHLKENFAGHKLNALSTVREYLSRGMEPEVAYGLKKPNWQSRNSNLEELLDNGYVLTGELKPSCKPIIIHRDKEIFSSIKEFCNARDFDYSSVSKLLKTRTAEQIIDKRQKRDI